MPWRKPIRTANSCPPLTMFKALRMQMDELGLTIDHRVRGLSALPGILALGAGLGPPRQVPGHSNCRASTSFRFTGSVRPNQSKQNLKDSLCLTTTYSFWVRHMVRFWRRSFCLAGIRSSRLPADGSGPHQFRRVSRQDPGSRPKRAGRTGLAAAARPSLCGGSCASRPARVRPHRLGDAAATIRIAGRQRTSGCDREVARAGMSIMNMPAVCTENLNPHVMVMKSAQDRV